MIVSRPMSQPRAVPSRRILAVAFLTGGFILAAAPVEAEDALPTQAERVAVGQEAPGFSLTGTDGRSYAPSDVRGQKDLVLIFFRGTW